MGKLSQALIYGAEVIQIEGNFDEALKLVVEISNSSPITLVNSINPYRIEGQKTAAYEVCDALGTAPDIHIVPVGNAGNITAYWYGYKDYHKLGKTKVLPKMVGCQAEGSAPFVIGKFVDNPETVATAIRIGHPASWDKAQVIKQESNGVFYSVTDKQIIEAQQLLASTEGIFCEPASAASLAGLIANKDRLNIQEGANIVLTLTGNGLKDTDTVMQYIPYRGKIVKPTIENVKNAIFG
jgi:threonine synthase